MPKQTANSIAVLLATRSRQPANVADGQRSLATIVMDEHIAAEITIVER
jgi:hypothetical protein